MAYCLVKMVVPTFGESTWEPVAIFNYDSEATTFQGHVFAEGLDKKLVEIDDGVRQLFEAQRDLRARRP